MSLKLHAPSGKFIISAEALKSAASSMKYAIRHVRILGKHPLEGAEIKGPLTDWGFAEAGILNAAQAHQY